MEIRELEAKLKSAYLNRARAAQIAEKEAIKYEAMVSVNFMSYIKVRKKCLKQQTGAIFSDVLYAERTS